MRSTIPHAPEMAFRRARAGGGRQIGAPVFVRQCTIGVNAKLSWCLSLFKIHSSSDAPRNEFAGGERGDNRGTKCPDPKALLDGIQQRFFICVHGFPPMVHRPARQSCPAPAFALHRIASALRRVPLFFPVPAIRLQAARRCAHVVRAYPVGVRESRPLHSAFADRAVGKTVGSSPTSRMQKRECGWMSSAGRWFGAGKAAGAACSSRGVATLIAAFPGRSAACTRAATPSRVVAFAPVSATS